MRKDNMQTMIDDNFVNSFSIKGLESEKEDKPKGLKHYREMRLETQFNHEVGKGMLKIVVEDHEDSDANISRNNIKEGKRGSCRGLSDKSHKTVNDKMQALSEKSATNDGKSPVFFLTLTFGQLFPNEITAKKYFLSFIKRLEYRFKGMACMWRMELQKRGAPHFHLLLFHMPFVNADLMRKLWLKSIDPKYAYITEEGEVKSPHLNIKELETWRGATSYVSKYISKKNGDTGPQSDPVDTANFIGMPYLSKIRFEAYYRVIDMIVKKALKDNFSKVPITFFDNQKHDDEFIFTALSFRDLSDFLDSPEHYQFIGFLIKYYMTAREFDWLCPPTGRHWGFRRRKFLEFFEKVLSTLEHQPKVLAMIKTFAGSLRDRDFSVDNSDIGFTFYINTVQEYELFLGLLERNSNIMEF